MRSRTAALAALVLRQGGWVSVCVLDVARWSAPSGGPNLDMLAGLQCSPFGSCAVVDNTLLFLPWARPVRGQKLAGVLSKTRSSISW